jgi:recombination protein RecT
MRFLTEAEHVIETSKNDALLRADRQSLLVALGEAAADRLSVNPTMGEAYLIVRKGKVCYQSGYKGLVRLAYRSDMIDSLHVDVVYDGEHYKRTGGTSPGIEHTPDDDKRTGKLADIVGAYAVVWLIGSSRPMFRAITRQTIIEAAEASGNPKDKSYSSVWIAHSEAMAWKTALIRCANQLPRSDKFRAFHFASSRAVLREVNVEPPPIAGLAGLQDVPALPPAPDYADRVPLCTGKAAGIAQAIRERRAAYAKLIGKPFVDVYKRALSRCSVPATDAGGMPEPEQLTVEDGKAVSALLKAAIEKHEADRVIDPEIIHNNSIEHAALDRQPGEDDPADVEPPDDWPGHDPSEDELAAGAP